MRRFLNVRLRGQRLDQSKLVMRLGFKFDIINQERFYFCARRRMSLSGLKPQGTSHIHMHGCWPKFLMYGAQRSNHRRCELEIISCHILVRGIPRICSKIAANYKYIRHRMYRGRDMNRVNILVVESKACGSHWCVECCEEEGEGRAAGRSSFTLVGQPRHLLSRLACWHTWLNK
jgi:hypothetical protein